jgi:4-alpha-glucanotransferase
VRWTDALDPLHVPIAATAATLVGDRGAIALAASDGRAALPPDLAPGHYALSAGGYSGFALVAPRGCHRPDPDPRAIGVFLPHHALHTDRTRGLGDLTALAELGRVAAAKGATVLATLPLLPTFLHAGAPYEPSPYAPVSRLFWGEHLVDPTATPEWERAPAARERLETARAAGELGRLRDPELVDPKGAWALQRDLLSALADAETARALAAWADARPENRAYARFRAATEQHGPWPAWPRAHDGDGGPGVAVDPARERLWIYAQRTAEAQLAALKGALEAVGARLYLDLPIGVHPDSFDTWYWGDAVFARGVSAGAPPDPYFPSGQDWGFPPIEPRRSAAIDGHGYLLACLRAHASMAHLLRLDHVMGFYRLYWVPSGLGARDGVYVRYPAEAWWAALCIASHEGGCAVVGENLGMVPPEVDATLAELSVRGMAVGQFHITHDPAHPLRPIPAGCVASLNTHDTPTFAGWWRGEDLDTVQALGWLPTERVDAERRGREVQRRAISPLADRGALAGTGAPQPLRIAAGLYRALAEGPAHLVLVNLEDLWAEDRPHNVPGTWRERPNWLRRARPSVDDIAASPIVAAVLADLRERR